MKDKVFGSDGILGTVTPPQLLRYFYRVIERDMKDKVFGSDGSLGTVTLPQLKG
jgi:hypothetical protein